MVIFDWPSQGPRALFYVSLWFFDADQKFIVQGGPSASGKKYVDIKLKVLFVAWVRG